jgi:hypothetical protein
MSAIKNVSIGQDFERDNNFYGHLNLLLTIKSFDLQAIRARYLAAKKNTSGRGGSVSRRAVSLGGIAQVSLQKGQLTIQNLVKDLKEPRGVAFADGKLALSLENKVLIYAEGKWHSLENDWFSYIHTVAFHPQDAEKILVTSSGYDCLFEYHWPSQKLTWQWFAWDHGLNQARHPAKDKNLWLTRHPQEAAAWAAKGQDFLLINQPAKDTLPTAKRAAFINTAHYAPNGKIWATLFHEGSVREIDQATGKHRIVLEGLKTPHGGQLVGQKSLVSSTGAGGVWYGTKADMASYNFTDFAGKAPEMEGAEWIQNTVPIQDDLLVSIDANRNALVVFSPQKKRYDLLPFNGNWAVQDLVPLEQGVEKALAQIPKS